MIQTCPHRWDRRLARSRVAGSAASAQRGRADHGGAARRSALRPPARPRLPRAVGPRSAAVPRAQGPTAPTAATCRASSRIRARRLLRGSRVGSLMRTELQRWAGASSRVDGDGFGHRFDRARRTAWRPGVHAWGVGVGCIGVLRRRRRIRSGEFFGSFVDRVSVRRARSSCPYFYGYDVLRATSRAEAREPYAPEPEARVRRRS